jgi:hypothetical protein
MSHFLESRASLQAEMRRVRAELAGEVDQVVVQAKELTDWRKLVSQHPWISFGLAAAGGYLLIPRRPAVIHADAQALQELSRNGGLILQPPKQTSTSLVVNLATAAAGLAVRSMLGAAERRLSQIFSDGSTRSKKSAGHAA